MGIFDKIKDALDGDDVQDAQKKVDDANQDLKDAKAERAEEAKEKAAEARERAAEAKQDLDEAKNDIQESAPKKAETTDKPKPKPAPAPSGGGSQTYTVKSGDTLSAIGAKYGVSYMDIAKASGIDTPDLIFPGQVLTIPGK